MLHDCSRPGYLFLMKEEQGREMAQQSVTHSCWLFSCGIIKLPIHFCTCFSFIDRSHYFQCLKPQVSDLRRYLQKIEEKITEMLHD